jgi:small subunit ribosomal protein S8
MDCIGDMLTRIRNGGAVGKVTVESPFSNLRKAVLDTLLREGYIRGFTIEKNEKNISYLNVDLKYFEGKPVIKTLQRISKPGRRVYSKIKDLPLACNGLGIYILSTQKGVISDEEARSHCVGGEVICFVF